MFGFSELFGWIRKPLGKSISIALVIWCAFALFIKTPEWQSIELKAYDFLTVLNAPKQTDLPITIIGIDEPSFAELKQQWPWSRSMHAQLIDELKRAGAAVIAFDIIFSEPSIAEDDESLARAIHDAGNVILAADIAYQNTPYFQQVMRIEALDIFRKAGAVSGIANISLDGDSVVRQIPSHEGSFWQEVTRQYRKTYPTWTNPPAIEQGSMIRYLGPAHSFPYISYYQALDPEQFLPPDIFRDRIVLIGLDIKTSPDPGAIQTDMFATPFLAHTGWLTSGAELHATMIVNALTGRVISKVSTPIVLALIGVILLICTVGMRQWQPLYSAIYAIIIVIGTGTVDFWLFVSYDIWVPVISPILAITVMYLAQGSVAFFHERRQKQYIKQAFGYYVSPHVVEEMVAHPDRLVLGGARRQLTLLFTDLKGFTDLSEKMSPEEVAQLLNKYFTDMTKIIHQYGGTVDKFIGDAIMAFWGAPTNDSEHAIHACKAAIEMQEALRKFRKESGQEIYMRVGLHSGSAVVGNMGSLDRFDYTAIGDSVNLASRLEGVNKLYGTEILLSGATADEIGCQLPLRHLDRICVKGKSESIEVFTFDASSKNESLNSEAITTYRQQEWDRSELLWKKIALKYPDDTVASLYMDRISKYRKHPPEPDWDGTASLDKM